MHAIQTMLLERKHMENAGATERKEEKSRQEKKNALATKRQKY